MNIIEIKNLHKIYNDDSVSVHAVNDVTVDIQEGGFTAIVGPSGSGKTTLLNIIGGLDDATQGSVKIGGYGNYRPFFQKINQLQNGKYWLCFSGV